MADIFGNTANAGAQGGGSKGMIIFMVIIACCCCYYCSCGLAYLMGWLDFVFKPNESSSTADSQSQSQSQSQSPDGQLTNTGDVGTCTEKLNGRKWETNSDGTAKAFIPFKHETCNGWCGFSARSNSWAKVKQLSNETGPKWHTATWSECKDNVNQRSYDLPDSILGRDVRIVNANKGLILICGGLGTTASLANSGTAAVITKEGKLNQYGRYTIKFDSCSNQYLTASNYGDSVFYSAKSDTEYQQWYFSPVDESKGKYNIISVGRVKDNRFLSAVPNSPTVVLWKAADSDRQQWTISAI